MATFSDSFTNTNGTTITAHNANWILCPTGATTFTIDTNALSTGAGTEKAAYWNVAINNDQWAQGTCASVPGTTDIFDGVAVRVQTPSASANWYGFWTRGGYASLHKIVAGTITNLGITDGGYLGQVIRLEVIGTTLTLKVDGVAQNPPGDITDTSFASGFCGVCGYGMTTADIVRLDDWSGGEFASTATERKSPDAIAASTNLSGAVANIQDDPDSPDGSWLTATSATSATDVRVTFPTPTGSPYGTQNFRVLLRMTTGATTPTTDVMLYQGGSLVATLVNDQPITSTTGQVVQATWQASQLTGTVNGSDVECRVASAAGIAYTPGTLPVLSATAGTLGTSTTLAASYTVAIPAHSAGDLLLLVVMVRTGGNNGTLASIDTAGWTQGGGTGTMYGGAQAARIGFGWKIGDGSETTVAVTTTGSGTTNRRLSRVYLITGANGFYNPPVVNIGTPTTGSSTSMSMPSVTRSGTNDLAVTVYGIGSNSTVAAATGESNGDWTEVVAESTATNGTIGLQRSAFTAATISGGTATLGTTGAWVAVGFSVMPGDIGGGAAVNTVEIGAIEWNVTYDVSTVPSGDEQPFVKRLGGVPFMSTIDFAW